MKIIKDLNNRLEYIEFNDNATTLKKIIEKEIKDLEELEGELESIKGYMVLIRLIKSLELGRIVIQHGTVDLLIMINKSLELEKKIIKSMNNDDLSYLGIKKTVEDLQEKRESLVIYDGILERVKEILKDRLKDHSQLLYNYPKDDKKGFVELAPKIISKINERLEQENIKGITNDIIKKDLEDLNEIAREEVRIEIQDRVNEAIQSLDFIR